MPTEQESLPPRYHTVRQALPLHNYIQQRKSFCKLRQRTLQQAMTPKCLTMYILSATTVAGHHRCPSDQRRKVRLYDYRLLWLGPPREPIARLGLRKPLR